MSFILDALKKLEHRQKRGSVPDLLTEQVSVEKKPKRRKIWFYVMLAVLLLNAGALAVWFSYRQPERHFEIAKSIDIQGPATTADTAKEDVADSAAPESALPPSRQVQSIPSEVKEEAIAEQAGVRPITDEMPLRDVLQEQQPSQEIHELLPVPEIAEPDFPWRGPEEVSPAIQEPPSIITTHPAHKSVPAEKTATIPGKKTISISDLPPSIRNGLPPISITGHIYSDNPSARIININGDIFREGEFVTEGLKVEEITPTGVILGFKGHRFHIRVF